MSENLWKIGLNQPPRNIREKPEEREKFIKTPSDLLKAYWGTIEEEL